MKTMLKTANLIWIAVLLLVGLSLFLRVNFQLDKVFAGTSVHFASIDAYYHMRLVDNFIHNFPSTMAFDPYTAFPNGTAAVGDNPLFVWLIGSVALLLGLGSPSPQLVDTVGAFTPAVLGALIVVPVYIIGKTLFGRVAGLLGAVAVAVLPGEFIGRTMLGFTDYHALETVLVTLVIMFMLLALKNRNTSKLVVYSLLTGVSIGAYMLAWSGALLIFFIIGVFLVIQFVIDHLKRRDMGYLIVIGIVPMVVAACSLLPMPTVDSLYFKVFPAVILLPIGLFTLSRIIRRAELKKSGLKPFAYPVALLVIGVAGYWVLGLLGPYVETSYGTTERSVLYNLTRPLVYMFGTAFGSSERAMIIEIQPMLFANGPFSLDLVWANFTSGVVLLPVAMLILIIVTIRSGDSGKTLLLVWCAVILLATMSQRRFAYYLAVNIAVVSGYVLWLIVRAADNSSKSLKGHVAKSVVGLAVMVALLLIVPLNLSRALNIVQNGGFWLNPSLQTSLDWMRDNTPEPMGSSDSYYAIYDDDYVYPSSAYGVLSVWDYGHYITRIARRLPNATPGTWGESLRYFSTQDVEDGYKVLDDGKIRYIIIDDSMLVGKFASIARMGHRDPSEFVNKYYYVMGDQAIPVTLFGTAFYETMGARLFIFGGQAVVPDNVIVIRWEYLYSKKGIAIRAISGEMAFPDYATAQAYVDFRSAEPDTQVWEIVGQYPNISPVPLERLERYRLVHQSDDIQVRIFEYTTALVVDRALQ